MGVTGRRVWIDLENSPHVPFFLPWIRWLREDGHEVLLTARDLSQTHELLRLHGLDFAELGGHGVGGVLGKSLRVLGRAGALAHWASRRRIDLALGHGSRAQTVAASLLGIPSLSFFDYEYISLRVFGLLCDQVFVPDAVSANLLARRGLPSGKLFSYPGYKEQIYLDLAPDAWAPSDPPLVLVRPPARRAHYHTDASERLYRALVERLLREARHCRIRFLPRYDEDRAELAALSETHAHVEVAQTAVEGKRLVRGAALVASGGGTMVREAAVLGVPSVSFFGGPVGGVDLALSRAGRMTLLRNESDVAALPLPTDASVEPWRASWMQRLADSPPMISSETVRATLRAAVARYLV